MRVFVTGASGHIGGAVTTELVSRGHAVTGLARSDTSAAALEAAGADVLRADLDDLGALADAARAADGVIHLAFKHDLLYAGDMAGAVDADLRVIAAFGEGLAGSNKPFVHTSTTAQLAFFGGLDRPATEADAPEGPHRMAAENAAIGLADDEIRATAVRLPPCVHSPLDTQGFIPSLIGIARSAGVVGYVGDGENRWPAVHTLDAALLYCLALEVGAPGSRFHAVADEGVPYRQVAEAIAAQLQLPVTSIDPADADEHFGVFSGFVSMDNPVSSAGTREQLGWSAAQPSLLDDLGQPHYWTE